MKILYFDVETSGLDPNHHSLIQLSGIVEIDGEVKESFDFKCKPCSEVEPSALKVQNRTLEEVSAWPEPRDAHKGFHAILNKYVDPYNQNDFFIPAGQNVAFDINFLYSFFKQCGDGYLGSFIQGRIDLMVLATIAYQRGKILPVDEKGKIRFKLQYICKALGIPLDGAHDAMADINATRLSIIKLLEGDTK